MSFETLGLSEGVLKAINDLGYEKPTPIQEKAIPVVLMGRDLVGLAQTGTGKTASFTLPMIEILSGGHAKARMPRSLILAPTRELAAQVAANFDQYGKYQKLSMALLVGGESMNDQIKILERGADVLIATPGRLLDLFDRGQILLNDIKVFVIDEADRMLDMGFIPDIEKIVSVLPQMRQTLLFSATMPNEIKKLTEKFLHNPRSVEVSPPASTSERVEQALVCVNSRDKYEALDVLLQEEDVKNAFIFCNRKKDVDKLASWLDRRGYKAKGMHGDMAQNVRTETLRGFKEGEIVLLVCSDVAARGIDIQGVSHVFNMDMPMNADDYVHRIGRTGRAGKSGMAWSFAAPEDKKFLDAVEKRIGQKIEVCEIEGLESPDLSKGDKSSSGSKGDGRSRGKSQKSSERNGRYKDKPQSQERGYQNSKSKPQKGKPSKRYESYEDDPSVVGFGDDVPSFMK